MNWGQPWSCFWGENEESWLVFEVEWLNERECRITALAFTDLEQNGVIVIDHVPITMRRVTETSPLSVVCQFPDPTLTEHVVSLVPWGDAEWPIRDTYPEDQQEIFDEDKSQMREFTFSPDPEYFVLVDDDKDTQLSNWDLSGLARFWMGTITPELRTRMTLYVVLETVLGVHTLSVYHDDTMEILLAQGSRTGDGAIALVAQHLDFILEGDVDLAYTGDFEGDLLIRYPAQFKLYQDGSLFKTIPADPRQSETVVVLGPFEVGPHDFKSKMVSDDGKTSGFSITTTETIPGPPDPCEGLHYLSGDFDDTIIAWTPAAGATTNIYDSALDEPTVMEDPINTALAQYQLPAVPIQAGKRYIVIDSTLGGIESGKRQLITIEYKADGSVVVFRPNVPTFAFMPFDANNVLNVRFTYTRPEEKTIGTKVNLYVTDDPSTFDFDTDLPVDTFDLTVIGLDGKIVVQDGGVLSYAIPSEESYYWLVRAANAADVLSENVDWQGPVFVEPTAPQAPAMSVRVV